MAGCLPNSNVPWGTIFPEIGRQFQVWFDPEQNCWKLWVTHPKATAVEEDKLLQPAQMYQCAWGPPHETESKLREKGEKYLQMWDDFAAAKELEWMVS